MKDHYNSKIYTVEELAQLAVPVGVVLRNLRSAATKKKEWPIETSRFAFAREAKIEPTVVENWESGKHPIRKQDLKSYLEALRGSPMPVDPIEYLRQAAKKLAPIYFEKLEVEQAQEREKKAKEVILLPHKHVVADSDLLNFLRVQQGLTIEQFYNNTGRRNHNVLYKNTGSRDLFEEAIAFFAGEKIADPRAWLDAKEKSVPLPYRYVALTVPFELQDKIGTIISHEAERQGLNDTQLSYIAKKSIYAVRTLKHKQQDTYGTAKPENIFDLIVTLDSKGAYDPTGWLIKKAQEFGIWHPPKDWIRNDLQAINDNTARYVHTTNYKYQPTIHPDGTWSLHPHIEFKITTPEKTNSSNPISKKEDKAFRDTMLILPHPHTEEAPGVAITEASVMTLARAVKLVRAAWFKAQGKNPDEAVAISKFALEIGIKSFRLGVIENEKNLDNPKTQPTSEEVIKLADGLGCDPRCADKAGWLIEEAHKLLAQSKPEDPVRTR